MNKLQLRSIGAVIAGLVIIAVASNGTDTILEQTGVFPSLSEQRLSGFDTPWMLATALAYRAVFAFLGGNITARLAPRLPRRHVLVLIAIGTVLGLVGTIAADGTAPAWFSVAVLAVTPIAAWIGGDKQSATTAPTAPAVNGGPARRPARAE